MSMVRRVNLPGAVADAVGGVKRHIDVAMVVLILAMLVVIIIQLPPALMDLALVFNLTLAVVILLTTIYVAKPLDFAVLPSLLLMTTFYRLALNIATTRLILGNTRSGPESYEAAGRVIRTFGMFVAGNNPVVGVVIFAIIVVIQFVVISKGATRISEVAARFTLDAMPGKQLSIDADLNAGFIDEQTARARRTEVMREADFYGAMDGASKFIRGDAIAGIIITLVNIIGGFLIGVTQRGMSFGEAAEIFTRLTIGDGLVSQIPALVISVGAGLIVTRSTARADLGKDVFAQMIHDPQSLFITAGFLLALLPSGLPWWALLGGATLCGATGWSLVRSGKQAARTRSEAAREVKKPQPEAVKDRALALDPLEVDVGYGLIGLVDGPGCGKLPDRIGSIREKIAMDLGFVVPPVRIRDNMQLEPNRYVVKLRGTQAATWVIEPDHFLAMAARDDVEPIEGTRTKDPAFGLGAVWIAEGAVARAEGLGYTVVDPTSVMATHLSELIRRHAADLLTREEVAGLIEHVKRKAPAVVAEVVPDLLKVGQIQKVLQHLLREGVSIRDLETILETLADWAPRTKDPEILGEYVRHGLSRALCERYVAADGKLHAVTVDPNLEEYIDQAIERTERGSHLALNPEMSARIIRELGEKLKTLVAEGHPPVVLCSPQIRYQLKRLLSAQLGDVAVLALSEVLPDVDVEVVGNVMVSV